MVLAWPRGSRNRPKVINFNLIPLELRRSQFSKGTLVLLAALLAGGLLFGRVYTGWVDTQAYVLDLQGQISTTKILSERETSRIAGEKTEATKLDQEIKRLKDQIARYSAAPVSRVGRQIRLAPAIDAILASQPVGLRVNSLTWQEPKLSLQGRAANLQLMMAYANTLQKSGRFSRVNLQLVDEVKTEAPKVAPGTTPANPPVLAPASSELAFVLDLEAAAEGKR